MPIVSLKTGTKSRSLLVGNAFYDPSTVARAVFGGGDTSGGSVNNIDYVVIATIGNAIEFGDLLNGCSQLAACSSSTRGIFGGGTSGGVTNVIQYITIASVGNAVDFGDLSNNYVVINCLF
jgi:uncharacterized protein YkvS